MNYNITEWPEFSINYWGITKCAHTSVKMALSRSRPKKFALTCARSDINFKSVLDQLWIHYDFSLCNYITPQQAAENTYENITVIRHPVERFISQFHFIRKCNALNILNVPKAASYDELLDVIEAGVDLDIHFRSQCSFIYNDSNLLVDRIFTVENIKQLEDYLGVIIPHYNKTNKTALLPQHTLARLQKVFKEDFVLYETNLL
jgi:hypothetical protein